MARRVHPAGDDLTGVGGGMPCTPAGRDDLPHMVVGPRHGVDHRPCRCPLHAEHLVLPDGARVDRPVDRVMVAGGVLLE